jgi:hypothetical protein
MPSYTTKIARIELDPKGGYRMFVPNIVPSILPKGVLLTQYRIEPIFENHGGTVNEEWIVIHTSQIPTVQAGDTISFYAPDTI